MKRFVIILALLLWGCLEKREPVAQTTAPPAAEAAVATPAPQAPQSPQLTLDPNVDRKQLDNGLTYYLRPNKKPEQRLSLMLAVRAGSVLEDEDQRGLAHFLEHMAFNGTKHFEKQEIVNYLESIGMQFGPDINAYTSFDQTVYMLDLPTDDPEIVEMGFRILSEWAHNIDLDPEEIEKERGVVLEEWRLSRGAGMRIANKQYPLYFKDSKYAERLPIGLPEVIKTAPPEAFQRFYETWYRPELMAVIAVGDYESAKMESLIKKHFAPIKPNPSAPDRVFDDVPSHDETLFSIETDPELTSTTVEVISKTEPIQVKTEADFRESIVASMYQGMLNNRLNELRSEANPPFVFGVVGAYNPVPNIRFVAMRAMVREGQWENGLEAILVELKRAQKHGFTQTEFERQKENTLRSYEKSFNERDKSESKGFSQSYVSHFLFDRTTSALGIEKSYELIQEFLPTVTLDEVNKKGKEDFPSTSRVITYSAPEKEGLAVPTEQDILTVLNKTEAMQVTPYEDNVNDAPLLPKKPEAGSVVSETKHDNPAVTEWKLSNGAQVVLYPTQHKNDEVVFAAQSPGGLSLAATEDLVPSSTATFLINESGLGAFDKIQLGKKLSGQIVSVSPNIGSTQEGFRGSASPKDLETLFKLVYLNFTEPRIDAKAVSSVKARIESFVINSLSNPTSYFFDQYSKKLYNNHPRVPSWDKSTLEEFNGPQSLAFYKDRFADASDFTFFFVGNFELENIKPLVETYLASLPNLGRTDTLVDHNVDPLSGQQELLVNKGMEPKSRVQLFMHGTATWTTEERYAASALDRILSIRLREVLREDKGGVYGVRADVSLDNWPEETWSTSVGFGCAPENVDSLIQDVKNVMKELREEEISDENLQKIHELQIRGYEDAIQNNGFWLGQLTFSYEHDLPLKNLVNYPERVDQWLSKTLIKEAAIKYLDETNLFVAKLFPEAEAQTGDSSGEE